MSKNKKKFIDNKIKNDFDFSSLLKDYCKEETIQEFKERLNDNPISSLLLNKKRLSKEELLKDKNLIPDKDDDLLFRFDKEEDRLGKSLDHFLGGYYILDPSSAFYSNYLRDVLPKNFLSLDLCAAPGGKTISLALRREDGLFLADDISYDRALEIDKNVQRLALSNVFSFSIDPLKLKLGKIFDLVILDAPCSGSGMIRKEKKMRDDFSLEKVNRLLPIQKNLLNKAYEFVKEGGYLLYSTCSLSIQEDENQVKDFLNSHSDMEEIKIKVEDSIIKGKYGYHMIPGIYQGEGIYFAILHKKGNSEVKLTEVKYEKESYSRKLKSYKYKDNVYLLPRMYEEIKNLPYISLGTKVFDLSEHAKCQFDYSYSKVCDSIPRLELTLEETISLIQGNEIRVKYNVEDGLYVLTYLNREICFGKKVDDRIKNYLPKGLRCTLK